jgi:iron complex transport system ATP-binding protein
MNLKLRDVSFAYNKTDILHRINLEFDQSGIYCLVGPNGSGKSTLLKCLMQINRPNGDILFNDNPIRTMKQSEISGIFGYVPQDCYSAFPITVFDMILLGRKPYMGWMPSEADIDIVAGNISLFGLEQYALRHMNQLSGGERQKVMIAAAVTKQPRILLLDEPTSSLDIRHQLEVMQHIKSIVRSRGVMTVIAIHDLSLASQYADHIVMLRHGQIFAHGAPKSVLTRENIKTVYGVGVEIYENGEINHIVPIEISD